MRTEVGREIIGRDHPAAVLSTVIDRAIDSHGGLVLVTGEAGIGKTTLVTEAAHHARRRGAVVLGGSCWDSDRAPGYWPWVQAVRGLRRTATDQAWAAVQDAAGADLATLLGEGRDTAPRHDEDTSADAFRLYDAITTALVAAAQHRPVVVVLDDLHWADADTLRLMEFAAQHTWFERLLLIGTYRDVEVEAQDHPLQPLLMPLIAKATTVTLTGLAPDEVGELITRTVGRQPEPGLVAEVHRRTGGNPFFVEQVARLWRADGTVTAVPPGVREAVRRRLSLLPEPVVDVLTAASVLGQDFHRRLLAACVAAPVAQVDQLLDRAVAARLVVQRGGGRFGFAHDLVRETLYGGLDEPARRHRHATVVRAVDASAALADRPFPADLARHADLSAGEIETSRVVDLLVAAARDASARLAGEEAAGHFRRALELVDDPARRARIALELGQELHHNGHKVEAWRHFREVAALARRIDDPEILARVALTAHRHRSPHAAEADELLREAHRGLIGEPEPGAPRDELIKDLIAGTERMARRGEDDEALTFSLWARHDAIWGLGTGHEREALTREMTEVARRTGDKDTALFAASLRWVALVELGDARYLGQLHSFAEMSAQLDVARYRLASLVDRSIIAAFRGEFDAAAAMLAEMSQQTEHQHSDFKFMHHHLRWALLLLQGRFGDIDALLGPLGRGDHPQIELLRAITAVERGDAETAHRHVSEIETAGPRYPRFMTPLWLRLKAQVAAATRHGRLCDEVRAALAPHRGQWMVSVYGCDISGPVDLWIAGVDAVQERWDDAVAGFTAARESADRMEARPWSVMARAGLADALAARQGAGDEPAVAALRAEVEREAAELGMRQVGTRRREEPAAPRVNTHRPAPSQPQMLHEFRREGAVWRLGYGGRVVHQPDAKGLRDLHLLLSQPGVDIPAVELLDPAAGPDLVAARRMGGDPVLDDEAKVQYRRRLGQLDEAIDRAALRGDEARAAALDAERTALLNELRAAAGLAGRSRRLGDEAERARKTVAARIRDTLRKLDEQHPDLAAHLREAVSTGTNCRYAPAEPIPWRLWSSPRADHGIVVAGTP